MSKVRANDFAPEWHRKKDFKPLTDTWFDNLFGRLMTVIDATTEDLEKREAVKSLVRKELSAWYDIVRYAKQNTDDLEYYDKLEYDKNLTAKRRVIK